jgi:hypothetical protein
VVVFSGDKHDAIVVQLLRGPGLRMGLRIVAQLRRRVLIQQRQVLVLEIDRVVMRVGAARSDVPFMAVFLIQHFCFA